MTRTHSKVYAKQSEGRAHILREALWECDAFSHRFQCAGTNSKQMKKQSTKVFTLGHSPDPDDAFMFYAIAENKIDLRGYRFEHQMEDIQTLNECALRGELHISAISIHAYAYVSKRYALLPCGASIGDGYGPIVVRKDLMPSIQ